MTGASVLFVDRHGALGGSQLMMLRVATRLADQGRAVRVLTTAGTDLSARTHAAGLPVVELPAVTQTDVRPTSGRLTAAAAARGVRSAWAEAAAVAERIDDDVVVSNAHWDHLPVLLAGRRRRVPPVLWLHDHARPGLARSVRGALAVSARTTVGCGPSIGAGLPRWAAPKVVCIPNGVDVATFAPRPGATRSGVLFLGRVQRDKGALDAVRAMGDAAVPVDARLTLAGPMTGGDAFESELRAAATALGDRCSLLGPRSDGPDLLASAAVFVFPSSHPEGLPLAVVEAMASGTPVVAYATPVTEQLLAGGAGVLVQPGDVPGLALAVGRLLRDPALAAQAGDQGRRDAVADYSLDGMVASFAAALDRAAR